MQTYVNQLLEDIQAAHRPVEPKKPDSELFSIEEHFEEIERWLVREPDYSFGTHCGLEPEQFPPIERLTEEQLRSICTAFCQLMNSWNLGTDIPENVPLSKAYLLLISSLNEKVNIVNSGYMIIGFCSCEPASCPFDKYCSCKDFEIDEDDGKFGSSEENNPETPF